MPFISDGNGGSTEHIGYVAGRYRDGSYSDLWTDVRRCAEHTFTAYAPACTCGWQGPAHPITDIAHIACRRTWTRHHASTRPAPTAPTKINVTVACSQLRPWPPT